MTLAATLGCGSEVRVEQRPAPPVVPCDADPAPAPDIVALQNISSGVFIGDTLHLAARIDGADAYVVLGIADPYVWLANRPTDFTGPANLLPAGPGAHARLRTDGISTSVDLIDTSIPDKPILKHSNSFLAEVPPAWQSIFTVVGNELLFCAALTPNPPPELHHVPVDGSLPPSPVMGGGFNVCNGLSHDAGGATGTTWFTWGALSDLFIFDATPSSLTPVADYQYNPDGVHAYGPVLSAASDGERIVFDPGNENEFFLYSVGSKAVTITHTLFTIDGPKRLLGVVDHIIYLATPKGIKAYDATTIGPPTNWDTLPLLDYFAEIPFGPDEPKLLAANAQYLAVVDAADQLYLVPRLKSGPVKPVEVRRERPTDATCTPEG